MLGNMTIQRNLMTINTHIKMEYSQLGLLLQNKKRTWKFGSGYKMMKIKICSSAKVSTPRKESLTITKNILSRLWLIHRDSNTISLFEN